MVNLSSCQSQAFQYHLSLETYSAQDQNYALQLSRKLKGSDGLFERLHTANITEGTLTINPSQTKEVENDTLLTLFKGGWAYKFIKENGENCVEWNIPGIGIIGLERDGTVYLDQDSAAPFLSSYDLVLETSKDLFINSLKVSSLTLNSPKTIIQSGGVVTTHRLHTNHTLIIDSNTEIINKAQPITRTGQLHAKHITGSGKLINHGHLKLEGTAESSSILGIAEIHNEKGWSLFDPIMETSHLHITSQNNTFLNKKGAQFKNRGTLVVDDSSTTSASFTNWGTMSLGEVKINRAATNWGTWNAG